MLQDEPRHKCCDTNVFTQMRNSEWHADTNMAKKPKASKRPKKLSPAKKLEKKDRPAPGGRACTAAARLTSSSRILISSRTLPNLGVHPAPQGSADAEAYRGASTRDFSSAGHALEQRAVGVGEHHQHHKMIGQILP